MTEDTVFVGDIDKKLNRDMNLTSDELRSIAVRMALGGEELGDFKDLIIAQLCARVAELLDDVNKLDRRTAHFNIKPIGAR